MIIVRKGFKVIIDHSDQAFIRLLDAVVNDLTWDDRECVDELSNAAKLN